MPSFGHPPIPTALRLSPALAPSPGPASWVQGSGPRRRRGRPARTRVLTARLAHPQSQVCVTKAPCLLPCRAMLLLSPTPRHDTTRHRTTQYDLRLTLMLCLSSLTQPALLGACISCGRASIAWHGSAILRSALERTPYLMNRRLLHSGRSGQRRDADFLKSPSEPGYRVCRPLPRPSLALGRP